MQFRIAGEKKDEKSFLSFRKKKYKDDAKYVDNNYFMLQEIFAGKLHFVKSVEIIPAMVVAEEHMHRSFRSIFRSVFSKAWKAVRKQWNCLWIRQDGSGKSMAAAGL